MNTLNFYSNTNYASAPMWGASDIIQELSSVYCMSHTNESMQSLQDHCLCSSQSDSMKSLPIYNNAEEYLAMFDMKNLYESSQASLSEKETRLEQNVEINISKAVSSKKKKNKSGKLDIKPKLLNLRFRILNNHITEFSCTTKKARSSTKEDLRRRSKYIGVSKNNSNWQALINVNHSKKYIGTFANEVQAARAFDLYSVAMRGDKASLNFSYTPQEMLERIEYFLEHGCVKFDS